MPPLNPRSCKARTVCAPGRLGSGLAPITAIDRGLNRNSKSLTFAASLCTDDLMRECVALEFGLIDVDAEAGQARQAAIAIFDVDRLIFHQRIGSDCRQ